MRVWDQVPPENLCDRHLLGEHREIHCIWSIHAGGMRAGGYANHPEVKRWATHLYALRRRHNRIAREMRNRGMNHKSPLPYAKSIKNRNKSGVSPGLWDDQLAVLRSKGCECEVPDA